MPNPNQKPEDLKKVSRAAALLVNLEDQTMEIRHPVETPVMWLTEISNPFNPRVETSI